MKTRSALLGVVGTAFAAWMLATPAAFAQGTFNPGVGSATNCNVGTSGATVQTKTCTVGSVSATMTAWGFTGNTLSGTSAKAGFTQGYLADWNSSGFGAYTGRKETGSMGHHAFDNLTSGCGSTSNGLSSLPSGCGGSIEAVLIDFGLSHVSLTNVGIGWMNGDADLMVWRWTGQGAPNMASQTAMGSTTPTSTAAAVLDGWTLVSALNMSTNSNGTVPQTATGGTDYSSYFLISTYFGAANGNLTAGNDKFKLNSFTVACLTSDCKPPPRDEAVPEPGSISLAAIALIVLVRLGSPRLRRSSQAAA